MAHEASFRSSGDYHPRLVYRFLRFGGCVLAPLADTRHTTSADIKVSCRHVQLALPDVPGGGHLPNVALRALCGEGQRIAWYHANTLRHILEAVATEGAQLLDIGGGVGYHYRLRRIGGCRGSDRADRLCHRLEPRQTVRHGQEEADSACWLRCCRCHRRHLQGSDSWTGVHA